ncbi:hypothetical protein TNCV_183451 [Trichonephila clavipes]|nr:hypothetical protein TNCV_183451 [Trichonephila clavipes]
MLDVTHQNELGSASKQHLTLITLHLISMYCSPSSSSQCLKVTEYMSLPYVHRDHPDEAYFRFFGLTPVATNNCSCI